MSVLTEEIESISEAIETQMPDSALTLDRLANAIHQIESWGRAYPEDIFIPMTSEDWKEHHEVLKSAGRSGTAAAGDCMRHVSAGILQILDDVMQ